jgi:hypothetical protein
MGFSRRRSTVRYWMAFQMTYSINDFRFQVETFIETLAFNEILEHYGDDLVEAVLDGVVDPMRSQIDDTTMWADFVSGWGE